MSDYLKREDVLENVLDQMAISDSMKAMSERIWNLQEADVVERELYDRALSDVIKHRKGKWVRKELQTKEFGRLLVVECSKCKKNQMCKSKYCPNCGTEMESADDV